MTLVWAWELTPRELISGFLFDTRQIRTTIHVARTPFVSSREVLAGTPYTYQLAVSRKSVCLELQRIAQELPELPASGDFRSGILVYDGSEIIASLVLPGNVTTHGYELVVARTGQGLGHRLLVEWCGRVKRFRVRPKQTITARALRAWLSAHADLVRAAMTRGLPVPRAVSLAVLSGEAELLLLEAGISV